MADAPSPLDSDETERAVQAQASGMPRWVKVFGIIAILVVVVFVVVLIVGGGDHGPGRHIGGKGSNTVTAEDHSGPPPGVTHEQP